MDAKTCQNCVHWRSMTPIVGICGMTESERGQPRDWDSKAVAFDFEGFEAWLRTKHDFGCNQWEGQDDS